MCASIVSSRLLSEMARVEGFHYEDTLTGFKWIGSRASTLNQSNYKSIFCYEEAIGFCCGDVVFDKDGISALGVFAELTHWVYDKGLSLTIHLQNLYNKYGEFVSNNGYFFLDDPTVVFRIFDRIRNEGNYMTHVGPYEVTNIRDLGEPGYDSSTADNYPTLPTSQTSPMMTISFSNGCVAQFRASGTEPKFKYYLELRGKPGLSRLSVHQELMVMSEVLLQELLCPHENGLYKSRKDTKLT
jgi:phosphomannomutase